MAAPTPTSILLSKSYALKSSTVGTNPGFGLRYPLALRCTFSWTVTDPTVYYQVFVYKGAYSPGVVGNAVLTTGVNATSALVISEMSGYNTGLQPGGTYTIHVHPINASSHASAGAMAYQTFTLPAAPTAATLATPTSLAAGTPDFHSVPLTWDDSVPNETGYILEVRKAGETALYGSYAMPGDSTSKNLSGLISGADYEARILSQSYDTGVGAIIYSPPTSWVQFSTVATDISGEVPAKLYVGETFNLYFYYLTDPTDEWTVSGDLTGISVYGGGSGDNYLILSGSYSTTGDRNFTLNARVGSEVISRSVTLRIVSVPVIHTDIGPLPAGSYYNRQFTIPSNEEAVIQFEATPPAESWVVNGSLPPGISFNAATGLLIGAVFRPRAFSVTLIAINEHGESLPVKFNFVFTAVTNGSNRAPYLGFINSDPYKTDLQMDVRSRDLRSYCNRADGLHIRHRDTFSPVAVISDGDTQLAGFTEAEFIISPENEFNGLILMTLKDFTESTDVDGNKFLLFTPLAFTSKEIEAKFAGINGPTGPNSPTPIKASGQLRIKTSAGAVLHSDLMTVIIDQSLVA